MAGYRSCEPQREAGLPRKQVAHAMFSVDERCVEEKSQRGDERGGDAFVLQRVPDAEAMLSHAVLWRLRRGASLLAGGF